MNESNVDQAKVLAWNGFIVRIQQLVEREHAKWLRGETQVSLIVATPSVAEVDMIRQVLAQIVLQAQQDVVKAALGPVVRACDMIDNSKSKNGAVAEARASLQVAYDELHKLKAQHPAEAKQSGERE